MNKLIILAVALLCGCATTPKTTPHVKVLKRPMLDVSKISPTKKPLAPLRLKSLSETVQVKADPQPGDLVVTIERVEGGISGDPGTWAYRGNCAKPVTVSGFIWISIFNWGTPDTWARPFNAQDNGTNATTYVPCMQRWHQSNEKFVPQLAMEFRGSATSAAKSLEDKAFESKWEAKKKELGKDAANWAMTADGQLVHLQ